MSLQKELTPAQLTARFMRSTQCDAPPPSAIYRNNTPSLVRAVAEFEPMGGVLIAYPGTVARPSTQIQLPPGGPRSFGIPNELIVRMQQADSPQPVRVFILCADTEQWPNVIADLTATAAALQIAFDPKLICFVPWDTDTYWTRDYGPWWIVNEATGYYGIAKHVYTSLGGGSVGLVEGAENVTSREGYGIFRPNDDYGADKFSDFLNAPIRKWNNANWNGAKTLPTIAPHDWFFTGLLNVGGNYMVTGDGIIASSYLAATQTELPIADEQQIVSPTCADVVAQRMNYILEQLNRFMGINTYHVLSDPSGTYIGHIDCWGKFLAPRKVLLAQSQNPQINQAYDAIADSFAAEGFTVYRVMCQDIYVPVADTPDTTAAYTNSLILNQCVYVPMAGGAYQAYDEQALAVYRSALPDHTIIGIQGKPETPWLGTDALHCRTRGVPRQVVDNWLQAQLLG